MDGNGLSESADAADLDVQDAAAAQLQRGAGIAAAADALIEADYSPKVGLS